VAKDKILVFALTLMFSGSSCLMAQTATFISAKAFDAIAVGETVEVRPGRDFPLERELAEEVGRLLSARGYSVVERGQVVVTVDSTTPLPGIAARNALNNEDRLRAMNFRRNDRGVTMRFDDENAKPGASVFVLRMTAYRPGQSNLWIGRVSAPDNGSGRRSTTLLMAQDLINVFGHSSADLARD